MKMGIVRQGETGLSPFVAMTTLNRYRKLRQFLLANDNSEKEKPENTGNKVRKYKIETLLP